MNFEEPLSLSLMLPCKNKRFFNLVKDFSRNLNPFNISGLTPYIEKIILVDLKVLKVLKITHIWIFSQHRLSTFFHFSSIFSHQVLSFEIIKFSLKKEFYRKKNFCLKKHTNIFLFLNNVTEKSELGIFLNKHLRTIVPVKKNVDTILDSFSKCILFDFDETSKIMEYRCYIISNKNLILSRELRKNRILKRMEKKFNTRTMMKRSLPNNSVFFKESNASKIRSLVRIIEIGPRITMKVLE